MTLTKNHIAFGLLLLVAAVLAAPLFANVAKGNGFTGYGGPTGVPVSASSTAYSVTTGASLRLLGTSTKRVAATIEPINCPGPLFLRFNDAPAAANTGKAVYASSTVNFGADMPMQKGGVQGITSTATCNVLVTEWRADQ